MVLSVPVTITGKRERGRKGGGERGGGKKRNNCGMQCVVFYRILENISEKSGIVKFFRCEEVAVLNETARQLSVD